MKQEFIIEFSYDYTVDFKRKQVLTVTGREGKADREGKAGRQPVSRLRTAADRPTVATTVALINILQMFYSLQIFISKHYTFYFSKQLCYISYDLKTYYMYHSHLLHIICYIYFWFLELGVVAGVFI